MVAEFSEKSPASNVTDDVESGDDLTPLRCWDCNINFTAKPYLHKHLFFHIKQPYIVLERIPLPPLKLTLKSTSDNIFEIVSCPGGTIKTPPLLKSPLEETDQKSKRQADNLAEGGVSDPPSAEVKIERKEAEEVPTLEEENNSEETANISFSPNFAEVQGIPSPLINSPISDRGISPSTNTSASSTTELTDISHNVAEYPSVPGAEPTPPPEPSPDYPKIRIKTTGLLKEPLTITEITDDNPEGDPDIVKDSNDSTLWPSTIEDPLKLPESDDNNILALFNNNEKAKDFGFCSSDSEYISLDRLEERNRGTMQLFNPTSTVSQSSPLDSLTGLPMQALAQQVSRLQPSSSNGLHQQNVLINIQQFPSPQPSYQPPPMYPHHPQPPMYQPYQYPPPHNMYYPPNPGYPPQHMPPPPQPQMNQLPPPNHQQPPMGPSPMGQPPMGQQPKPPISQGQGMNQMQPGTNYRQPMPPRQPAPRQQVPGQRMPMAPRQAMAPRQPTTRTRSPMVRPRGAAPQAVRGPRPRMAGPQNGQSVRPQTSPMKRTQDQQNTNSQMQAKKKRLDLLTPDKDDDDCQVICMQPKNTDGGLPQIESVQGGTSEPAESSIMHLSDSITLSVRNPPPKRPESPKKSDAKAVANILATRGITVTATGKPKEVTKTTAALPSSLNLNGAVSILPAPKNSNGTSKNSESLPTVDLTDDSPPTPAPKQVNTPQKQQRPGLPYRCDLCPAQYPNMMGLNKHRQSYHKTSGAMCDLGIPLINLKQPGILSRLSSIGVNNYIPLPPSGSDGTFALPIISTRNPGNVSALGATQMLTLGPIRSIPKPQANTTNNAQRQQNHNQKS